MGSEITPRLPDLVSQSVLLQVAVNTCIPVIEGTIRDAALYERNAARELACRRSAKRTGQFDAFSERIRSLSRQCLARSDIKADLRELATECSDLFADESFLADLRSVYVCLKSLRRGFKVIGRRVERAFLRHTTLYSNESLTQAEADEVLTVAIG